MATQYTINGKKVSTAEIFRGAGNPIAGSFHMFLKTLRLPMATLSDIPAVRDLNDFEVGEMGLSQTARDGMALEVAELERLGFSACLRQFIHEEQNRTTHEMIHMAHESGNVFASIHDVAIHVMVPAKRRHFVSLYTHFTDGQTLVTTSAKPDWDDPETLDVAYHPKHTPQQLWQEHQSRLLTQQHRNVMTAHDATQVRYLLKIIHGEVAHFLVERGLFVPEEQAPPAYGEEAANPFLQQADPDVRAVARQIVKDTNKPQNTQAMLLILFISIGVFIGLGASAWSMRFVLLLIPVLLVHELGHWVAMKIFRYRNMKMFFIPLLGAAVTGQSHNVAGWKKVLVYLAGPLPGLVLGTVLGIAGIMQENQILSELGSLMLFINALNLLPILPLDGGWVMHLILFSRHPILQVIFRGLTAFGLIAMFLLFQDRFLLFLGIFLLIGTPVVWKTAQATEDLKKLPLDLEPDEKQVIPQQTLTAIVNRLKQVFPKPMLTKTMATHCMSVYESMASRKPGVLSSIGFGLLQMGSIGATVIVGLILFMGNMGFLNRDFINTAIQMPQIIYVTGTMQTDDKASPQALAAERVTLIGMASSEEEALKAYALVQARMPENGTLTRFGQIVMLELPASATDAREDWFERFEQQQLNPQVQHDQNNVMFNLAFIAPTFEKAQSIQQLGRQSSLGSEPLIMPWHPTLQPTEAHQKARRTLELIYDRQSALDVDDLVEAMEGTEVAPKAKNDDPLEKEIEQLQTQMLQSIRKGDTQKMEQLGKEVQVLEKKQEQQRIAAIATEHAAEIDPAVIELYNRRPEYAFNEDTQAMEDYRKAWKQYQSQLDQLLGVIEKEDIASRRFGMKNLEFNATSLLLHAGYIHFDHPATGLPNFVRWLEAEKCQQIRYGLSPVLDSVFD